MPNFSFNLTKHLHYQKNKQIHFQHHYHQQQKVHLL